MLYFGSERERETERQRDRERERHRERDRETKRERQRDTERKRFYDFPGRNKNDLNFRGNALRVTKKWNRWGRERKRGWHLMRAIGPFEFVTDFSIY